MGLTVNSAFQPFCTPANFVTLMDWRTYAQLASDTGTPLASSAALQSSVVLASCLALAAGEIEAAVTIGERYDPKDLVILVTPIATVICNSGWKLIELNAVLAAMKMYERRFEGLPPELKDRAEWAKENLAALETGTAIFAFTETQAAGLLQDYKETAADVEARNLPSFIAQNLFGRRANRVGPWNGGQW